MPSGSTVPRDRPQPAETRTSHGAQAAAPARQPIRERIAAMLAAPPLSADSGTHPLDAVRYDERIRAKVRSVDLSAIAFEPGSATIGTTQLDALTAIGAALRTILSRRPAELFLIEGHADASGSEYANLILSDRRAEAVAAALIRHFGIPADNLITQGYGDRYPKVPTRGPERLNRRVTLRRITPLLDAAAVSELLSTDARPPA